MDLKMVFFSGGETGEEGIVEGFKSYRSLSGGPFHTPYPMGHLCIILTG